MIFIINPELTINSMLEGINLWATKILPALFPFFVLTKLLSISGSFDFVSTKLTTITKKIYKTPGISSYVFICSIISGYPVGTKIIQELYSLNKINTNDAKKILSFTSTSGPLFVIGTVGIGMFQDKILGYLVMISHILSSLINGLLYKNRYMTTTALDSKNNNNFQINIDDIIHSSITSILIVGAYISLFYMLISILDYYQIFNPIINICIKLMPNIGQTIKSILFGVLEVTKGCLTLSQTTNNKLLQLIVSTALISFGGLSIHMQSYTFIKKCNIKYKTFLIQKLTQTTISIIVSCIVGYIYYIK